MFREGIIGNHMFGVPSVDVKTIGAGGGSIAWVDPGGFIHVGPQSAQAIPGPACYMRGGTEPTVTDANLVRGFLDPDYFVGGAMKLSPELAEEVIRDQIATPLKMTVPEAAALVISQISLAEERKNGAYDLLVEAYETINVRYLGRSLGGFGFYLYTNVKVETPWDLAGQKMRGVKLWGGIVIKVSGSWLYNDRDRYIYDVNSLLDWKVLSI